MRPSALQVVLLASLYAVLFALLAGSELIYLWSPTIPIRAECSIDRVDEMTGPKDLKDCSFSSEAVRFQDFAFSFRFKPESFLGFPNAFQTDGANTGLRLELVADGRLFLGIGQPNGKFQGFVTQDRALLKAWNTFKLSYTSTGGFDCWLNNVPFAVGVRSKMHPSFSNPKVGVGFNENRKFSGAIEDFKLSLSDYSPKQFGFKRMFFMVNQKYFSALMILFWLLPTGILLRAKRDE